MYQMISGAVMMQCWVVALFFLKFWDKTRDRLFGIFAVAFGILGIERLVLTLSNSPQEDQLFVYLLRLSAFLLIIFGIIDRNRRSEST